MCERIVLLFETKLSGSGPEQDVAAKKQHENAQRADSKRGFPIGAHIRRLLPMFFHES